MKDTKGKTTHVESVTVSRSRKLNGRAMLTWEAHCHNSPPVGVNTGIQVVLLPDLTTLLFPDSEPGL